jgi:hypothetical protein
MFGLPFSLMNPPAVGFSPSSISGLMLWLDASAAGSITIGTGVSQWNDLSGNGRNATQSTGSKQPAYGSTAFNGLPGLTFTGSSLGTPTFAQPTSLSLYLALIPVSWPTYSKLIYTSYSTDMDLSTDGGSPPNLSVNMNSQFSIGSSPTPTTGTPHIVKYLYSSSTEIGVLSVDSSSVSRSALNPPEGSNLPFFIGSDNIASENCNVVLGELLLFNSALITGNDSAVTNYLRSKWGTP